MGSCLTLLGLTLAAASSPPSPPPNIVLIVADDLGYGDVGCYGCQDISTPAIDRLAGQGVRLTHFYANGPECSPTRTALMTGRYQQRIGGLECAIGTANVGRYDDAIRLRAEHQLGLPPERNTLLRGLKASGHVATCIGKWHLGYEPRFFPLQHGFDHAFGPLGGGVDYFFHTEWDGTPMLYLNGRPIQREGYLTDLITQEAVAFLRKQESKPFFLYVPYTAPHTPYQGPDDRGQEPLLEDQWNKGDRKTYVKMVERLDEGIGTILKALDETKKREQTLVVFVSDNGPTKAGSAAPFSGHKSTLFEGGIRVPCIIRWPGHLDADRESDVPSMTMDLTASLLRIAGVDESVEHPLDGIDIVGVLQGKEQRTDRALFWRSRRGNLTWRAVQQGGMKYLSRQDGETREEYLFDLTQDPSEKHNLLDQRSEVVEQLKRLLASWASQVELQR